MQDRFDWAVWRFSAADSSFVVVSLMRLKVSSRMSSRFVRGVGCFALNFESRRFWMSRNCVASKASSL